MSILEAANLHKPDWGLNEDDLDKIILREKLKDKTTDFSERISKLTQIFDSKAGIRIIEFNENSGGDRKSRNFFLSFIYGNRHLFYNGTLSNKEKCVIFVSSSSLQRLKTSRHLLPHEYAHHIECAHAGFPHYIHKDDPPVWVPSFFEPCEIGPNRGVPYIDNIHIPDFDYDLIIRDSCERISDLIVEGILREKNLSNSYLDLYKELRFKEPAILISPTSIRYIRRLALRDSAEYSACLQLAFPKCDLTRIISPKKKHSIQLNKKYLSKSKVRSIFKDIFELCKNTDFNLFKNPEKADNYTKTILNLLKIKISNW